MRITPPLARRQVGLDDSRAKGGGGDLTQKGSWAGFDRRPTDRCCPAGERIKRETRAGQRPVQDGFGRHLLDLASLSAPGLLAGGSVSSMRRVASAKRRRNLLLVTLLERCLCLVAELDCGLVGRPLLRERRIETALAPMGVGRRGHGRRRHVDLRGGGRGVVIREMGELS